MEKPFKGINVGMEPFVIPYNDTLVQLLPTEIYLKENATLTDGPGFAIVLRLPADMTEKLGCPFPTVVGQLSLEMFNDGLADIGYKIIKTD